MFPLYTNPTAQDGMTPNKRNPYFSGLQTNIPLRINEKWLSNECEECGGDCSRLLLRAHKLMSRN